MHQVAEFVRALRDPEVRRAVRVEDLVVAVRGEPVRRRECGMSERGGDELTLEVEPATVSHGAQVLGTCQHSGSFSDSDLKFKLAPFLRASKVAQSDCLAPQRDRVDTYPARRAGPGTRLRVREADDD